MRAGLFLIAILLSPQVWAQDLGLQPAATTVTVPDARNLAAGWWKYIDEAGPALTERTAALIASAEANVQAIEELNGSSDDAITGYLGRLRVNLRALPALVAEAGAAARPVPPTAEQYSLHDYLAIERELRQARREAAELAYAIRRGGNAVRAAEKRIDGLLAAYITLGVADPRRLRSGLQIMALRSEWAITREQLRIRNESLDALNKRIEQLAALLETAGGLLVATTDEATRIENDRKTLQAKLDEVQVELRDRQSRALGAQGDTPEGRSDSALRDLRVMETAALERAVEIEIAINDIQQHWLQLELGDDTERDANLAAAQQQLDKTENFLAQVRNDLNEWQQQAERELGSLRLDDQDESKKIIKINQTRLETANSVLQEVARARNLTGDAVFMTNLLRKEVSAEQGVVGSGISTVWLWVKGFWSNVKSWGSTSLFKLGETPVTSFGLLRVGLIVFVAIWISRLFRHGLNRFGSRKEGTQSAFYTVGRLAHYVIVALAAVVGLSSIGLSFANLAIVAGALGVGIGFGLQSIVNNFVSGLILLFERSIKVGDYVQLESGVGGIVKEINVRSTLINTNDNLDILVPNSEFVSGRLTNWTLMEASRRMHIPFGVAYGTNKEKVKKAVLEAIDNLPHTVQGNASKQAQIWLVNFGDSSLDFELVVWVKPASVRRPARVHADYLWAIETALIENDIEIPFPQRDLHIRSGFRPEPGDPDKNHPQDLPQPV